MFPTKSRTVPQIALLGTLTFSVVSWSTFQPSGSVSLAVFFRSERSPMSSRCCHWVVLWSQSSTHCPHLRIQHQVTSILLLQHRCFGVVKHWRDFSCALILFFGKSRSPEMQHLPKGKSEFLFFEFFIVYKATFLQFVWIQWSPFDWNHFNSHLNNSNCANFLMMHLHLRELDLSFVVCLNCAGFWFETRGVRCKFPFCGDSAVQFNPMSQNVLDFRPRVAARRATYLRHSALHVEFVAVFAADPQLPPGETS